MSAINARLWSGCGTFRLTDMENAGKSGKLCRVLRFSGAPWNWENLSHATEPQKAAARWSRQIYYKVYELAGVDCTYQHEIEIKMDFPAVKAILEGMLRKAAEEGVRIDGSDLGLYEESIKGVRAPMPPLTAGVPGKWSYGADESGISGRQLDDVNEWSEITHGQTGNAAYRIAVKVWDRVKAAKTMGEATEILRAAGARLHGYCGLD